MTPTKRTVKWCEICWEEAGDFPKQSQKEGSDCENCLATRSFNRQSFPKEEAEHPTIVGKVQALLACPACDGSGGGRTGWGDMEDFEECRDCNAKGVVTSEKEWDKIVRKIEREYLEYEFGSVHSEDSEVPF